MNGHGWSYYVSQRGKWPMLVLGGRSGERIRINDSVDLVVLGIGRDHVRLGIESEADGLNQSVFVLDSVNCLFSNAWPPP